MTSLDGHFATISSDPTLARRAEEIPDIFACYGFFLKDAPDEMTKKPDR